LFRTHEGVTLVNWIAIEKNYVSQYSQELFASQKILGFFFWNSIIGEIFLMYMKHSIYSNVQGQPLEAGILWHNHWPSWTEQEEEQLRLQNARDQTAVRVLQVCKIS
jgi:hypothetical protein